MVNNNPTLTLIAAALRADVPLILWGPPGVCKTSLITVYGRAWGYHVETIVGSIREPTDFLGLPIEQDNAVTYAPPAWVRRLVSADNGILHLDELTTCAVSVQRVMLRICQEREVGELPLGPDVRIIVTANPPDVAVDGIDLAAPLANRFCHADWVFDAQSWSVAAAAQFKNTQVPNLETLIGPHNTDHAASTTGTVLAFCQLRPDLLIQVPSDMSQAGKAWPSPRSWTNAMSLMAELPPDNDAAAFMALAGCVGEAAATEFTAWKEANDLYDPIVVLQDPSTVAWTSDRPDKLFALLLSIATLVSQGRGKDRWLQAAEVMTACAKAGKPDVALPTVRILLANAPKGVQPPAALARAFGDLFRRSGRWAAESE